MAKRAEDTREIFSGNIQQILDEYSVNTQKILRGYSRVIAYEQVTERALEGSLGRN